jgi:hypothetical protein
VGFECSVMFVAFLVDDILYVSYAYWCVMLHWKHIMVHLL